MKNIDLKGYEGFLLKSDDNSIEAKRLRIYCLLNNIKLLLINNNNFPENYIPSGSVEWCSLIFKKNIIPEYYPNWLDNYLYRKVWKSNEWILGKKLFVKPADRYKRFSGFITHGTYSKKKKPPFWYSDIVYFINEWRYYISNGKILCGEWYWGDEINTPEAPLLNNLKIPKNYCGALDFGMLKNSKLALIEAQHPFACGWYGKQEKDHIYFQWLIDGWIYMKNLFL